MSLIDERIGPEPLLQSLPADDLAVALEQNGQQLESLAAEFQLPSALTQLPTLKVSLKVSRNVRLDAGALFLPTPIVLAFFAIFLISFGRRQTP